MKRTKPRGAMLSRKVSEEINNDSVHTTASEMRGPDSDQVISSSSCSRHVRVVSSDDTLGSTNSKKRAVELIRELSFDFPLSPRTTSTCCDPDKTLTSSAEKASSAEEVASPSTINHGVLLPDDEVSSHDGSAARNDEPIELETEERVLPPIAPSSPPLPPKINRIGLPTHGTDILPNQILHNRNRARSTSISEMSESYFNEIMMIGAEDDSVSTCPSNNDESEAINKKKASLITIENNFIPSSPHHLASGPLPLWNRERSSTMASDQSSYISSSSSNGSSGSLSISSHEEEVVDVECCQDYINVDAMDLENDSFLAGHLSLQDGNCNAYLGDSGAAGLSDQKVLRPRLNADTLREWNIMCEEEFSKEGTATKDQFIFRALSCPYEINAASSPERANIICTDPQDEDDSSEEGPHLLATGLSHVISQSLWSYTNSGSPSTISSNDNHGQQEDAISDLDFDMGFIHTFSLDKSSVSANSTPVMDGMDRVNNCHRRSQSSGCRLAKPLLLPKAVLNQEDGRPTNKPCPTRKHRRFKSDGSILCNKKQTILSQVNFSFSEGPSFKSKFSARCHQRGKSLDSFKESQFFDCAPLQCILEETSKSSSHNSAANMSFCTIVCLVDFLKLHLDNLRSIHVLELGIVLGLLVGLMIPYVLNVY